MTTPRIIYAKHLVASPAHYPQLAKGEPCKKGETAAKSGCTPASGKGGGVGSDWRVTGEDPHWTGGPAYKEPPDDPKMISAWEKAVSSPEDFSREELLNLLSWNERWQEDYSDESMIEEFGKPLTHADAAEMIRELEAEGGGGAKEPQPAPAGGGGEWTKDRVRAEEARSESPQAAQKASDSAEGKWLPKIRTLDHLIKAGWTIENEAASLERENAEKIKAGRFDQIDFDEIVRVNSETLFIRNWMKEHKEKTGGLGDYEPDQIPLNPLVSSPSRIMGS